LWAVGTIAALSASDIWVAGTAFPGPDGLGFSVTEQFNGTTWSVAPDLHPGESSGVPDDFLAAITAVEPHTLLAIGDQSLPDQGFCFSPHDLAATLDR
jgi:hypothetical protein